MVTEQQALIGTSNWTPDYFLKTGGIGFIFSSSVANVISNSSSRILEEEMQSSRFDRATNRVRQLDKIRYKTNSATTGRAKYNVDIANMHQQLNDVFMRDWNSPYASENV